MRGVLLFVGSCLLTSIAFGQAKYVRFEHMSMDKDQIYILTISTNKTGIPKKANKAGWEQMLITKAANYTDLCKGIKQNEYLKMTARHPKNDKPFYKVEVNGASFLLDEGNAFTFFRKLTLFMRKKPADKDIADKLDQINTRIGR